MLFYLFYFYFLWVPAPPSAGLCLQKAHKSARDWQEAAQIQTEALAGLREESKPERTGVTIGKTGDERRDSSSIPFSPNTA